MGHKQVPILRMRLDVGIKATKAWLQTLPAWSKRKGKKSEFKPALDCLKIDFVSYVARDTEVGYNMHFLSIVKWCAIYFDCNKKVIVVLQTFAFFIAVNISLVSQNQTAI